MNTTEVLPLQGKIYFSFLNATNLMPRRGIDTTFYQNRICFLTITSLSVISYSKFLIQ